MPCKGSLVQRELSAQLTEGLSSLVRVRRFYYSEIMTGSPAQRSFPPRTVTVSPVM